MHQRSAVEIVQNGGLYREDLRVDSDFELVEEASSAAAAVGGRRVADDDDCAEEDDDLPFEPDLGGGGGLGGSPRGGRGGAEGEAVKKATTSPVSEGLVT